MEFVEENEIEIPIFEKFDGSKETTCSRRNDQTGLTDRFIEIRRSSLL